MSPWVYLSAAEDYPISELEAEKYRQMCGFRERAQEDWKAWALKSGGEVIAMEGPTFKLRVPADALHEVPQLHTNHMMTSNQSISIGIGTRMSDAEDALKVAQLNGADSVVLWGPEAQEKLAQAQDKDLNKAEDKSPPEASGPESPEGPQSPGPQPLGANSPAAGGGFMSPQSAQDGQDEQVPDQSDPHEVLGALASQQGQKDGENKAQQDQADAQEAAVGDLKSQLVDVLKVFKERGQELEGLSQQDPELYKALTGMVQILVAMSRDYFGGGDQMQKAEAEENILWELAHAAGHDNTGLAVLSDYAAERGLDLQVHGANNPAAQVAQGYGQGPQQFRPGLGFGPHGPGVGPAATRCVGCGEPIQWNYSDNKCGSCWDKQVRGIGAQNAADVANHPELSQADLDTRLEFADRRILSRNNGTPIPGEELSDETLKAGLEPSGAKKKITLPVGSNKDPGPTGTRDAGKIKIEDPSTGHSKWRSVRAGLVMAPDGTPVSSRNPSGR